MRWRRAAVAVAVMAGVILPACNAYTMTLRPNETKVQILGGEIDGGALEPAPAPVLQELPGPLPEAAAPAVEEAVLSAAPAVFDLAQWTAMMRTMRAKDLIELVWNGTPHVETMLYIACREAGLGKSRNGSCSASQRDYDWRGPTADAQACSANNPTSSAAGLFQTIGGHRRLAAGLGLSWGDIEGPDCLADVLLAWQLYNHGRGLRNWSM